MITQNKYYCYRHIRLDKNEPFYVGIGTKIKEYNSHYTEYKRAYSQQRSGFWKLLVKKVGTYEVEIMFESDSLPEILLKEIELIKLYGRKDLNKGTLVNLTDGGEGPTNHIPSQSTRDKISAGLKGKPKSNAMKTKLVKYLTGRKFSDTTKKKLSDNHASKKADYINPCSGKKMSEEVKQKIILNLKGRHLHQATEFKSKPITQYDLHGNKIKDWAGAKEAAQSIGCSVGLITHCCRGRTKTAKSFLWVYTQV
jgi:hypothetical protein